MKPGCGYKVPDDDVFATISDLTRFVGFEMGYGPDMVLSRKALLESHSGMFWADDTGTNGCGMALMLVRKGTIVGLSHGGGGWLPIWCPFLIPSLTWESFFSAMPKAMVSNRSSSSAYWASPKPVITHNKTVCLAQRSWKSQLDGSRKTAKRRVSN